MDDFNGSPSRTGRPTSEHRLRVKKAILTIEELGLHAAMAKDIARRAGVQTELVLIDVGRERTAGLKIAPKILSTINQDGRTKEAIFEEMLDKVAQAGFVMWGNTKDCFEDAVLSRLTLNRLRLMNERRRRHQTKEWSRKQSQIAGLIAACPIFREVLLPSKKTSAWELLPIQSERKL